MSQVATAEPGREANLYPQPFECARCQEPMLHLYELWCDSPLARWWRLTCGECGSALDAWEDLATSPRWPVPAPEEE